MMTLIRHLAFVVATGLPLVACGLLPFSGTKSSGGGGAFQPTAEQQHTVDKMNAYRAAGGIGALTIDGQLSAFAAAGSKQLAADNTPHAHFEAAGTAVFSQGFCSPAAENQAPDWASSDVVGSIDGILAMMMKEGPGGGHYDNIMNAQLTRVGVGLEIINSGLYYTTDFSGACR